MIEKNVLIAILSEMEPGELIDMLATKGIKIGNPEPQLDDSDLRVEGWNEKDISIGPSNKPGIADPNRLIKIPVMQPKRPVPEYLDDEYEPVMDDDQGLGDGGY